MLRALGFLLLNTAIAWAAFQAGQRAESHRLRSIAYGIGFFFCVLVMITVLRYVLTAVLVLAGIP